MYTSWYRKLQFDYCWFITFILSNVEIQKATSDKRFPLCYVLAAPLNYLLLAFAISLSFFLSSFFHLCCNLLYRPSKQSPSSLPARIDCLIKNGRLLSPSYANDKTSFLDYLLGFGISCRSAPRRTDAKERSDLNFFIYPYTRYIVKSC